MNITNSWKCPYFSEFQNLLSQLKIGKATSGGDDGHGHEEDTHDHRRKREVTNTMIHRQKRATEEEDEKSPVSQVSEGIPMLIFLLFPKECHQKNNYLKFRIPAV